LLRISLAEIDGALCESSRNRSKREKGDFSCEKSPFRYEFFQRSGPVFQTTTLLSRNPQLLADRRPRSAVSSVITPVVRAFRSPLPNSAVPWSSSRVSAPILSVDLVRSLLLEDRSSVEIRVVQFLCENTAPQKFCYVQISREMWKNSGSGPPAQVIPLSCIDSPAAWRYLSRMELVGAHFAAWTTRRRQTGGQIPLRTSSPRRRRS
jgi:hypothetical protein